MPNSIQSNAISALINPSNGNDTDEDRKFLRAAAEAIVATSMNNEIDPTILELLKRIQYANANPNTSLKSNNNNNQSSGNFNINNNNSHSTFDQLHNNNNSSNNNNNNNNINNSHAGGPLDLSFLTGNSNNNSSSNNNNLSNNGFNFLNNNNDNSSNNNNNENNNNNNNNNSHFPLFNLNYFDSLEGKVTSSNDSNNNNDSSKNNTTRQSFSGKTPGSSSTWNYNSVITPSEATHHSPLNALTTPHQNQADSHSNSSSQPTTPHSSSSNFVDGEKPFICADCSLCFRRSSDLRRHQRAHMPILPHICQMCGKGFARKDALKRHVDTLTCKRNREKLINSGGEPPNSDGRSRNNSSGSGFL